MTKYTLLIKETGDGPARARMFDTAAEAVDILDEWRRGGATVHVILRGDSTIDEAELRRDAEAERTFDVG